MLHDTKNVGTRHHLVYNRKFLKTAIFAVSVLFAVFLFAGIVYAQVDVGLERVGEVSGLSGEDIRITIARVIRNIFAVMGILLVGLFVYAGYLYMTAGGDSKKVDTSKTIMKNAVIGATIALMAFAIAQFVLSQLLAGLYGGARGGPGAGAVFEPLSGSLGRGIVQTHYPGRSETGIPRNTMISITFKEPIQPQSIIADTNGNGAFGDAGDLINAENIKISKSSERDDGPYLLNIAGRMTDDHQTFVFDPADLLGSPSENTWYTIVIEPEVKLENGADAFVGSFADGYRWEFEVSTFLDLTPPKISSVVPRNGTQPRNIIIQINFNEAIDPTSASGKVDVAVSGAVTGMRNIEVRAGENILAGKFSIGNGYRTVEFATNDLCGMNSCGGEVYCLPGNVDINIKIKAATLGGEPPASSGFPYDGVVDMVGNSFDGTGEGVASGPPDDNYAWTFRTNNTIDLRPPRLTSIAPPLNEGSISLDTSVNMIFSKIMSLTTLNTSNISLIPTPDHELWYDIRSNNLNKSGDPVGPDEDPENTSAEIKHGSFAPSIEGTRYDYHSGVLSGAKDIMQNCYFPGAGPGGICADISAETPFCCDGATSGERCAYLP